MQLPLRFFLREPSISLGSSMNSNLRAVATLSWILLLLLGLGSCGTTDSSVQPGKEKRSKYLELDDLNAFESPATGLTASHDYASEEAFLNVAKSSKPKKLVKRDAQNSAQGNTKRSRTPRQNQAKQRPGFFWTIAKVTYETFNDTRSAIQQIGQIINDSIPPEQPKRKPGSGSLKKPITPAKTAVKAGNTTAITATTLAPTTTTEFKLTRPLLQSIVRRNVKGLVRLFNIEWRDAIDQSKKNAQEFRSDLGKQIGMYLQDNPNNY